MGEGPKDVRDDVGRFDAPRQDDMVGRGEPDIVGRGVAGAEPLTPASGAYPPASRDTSATPDATREMAEIRAEIEQKRTDISETIDVDRDQMTGTMEAYLSVVANRTNEIMKVLTIFSAIMLPLSLIAGIYGMNFEHMPELRWIHGYPFALGLMIGISVLMLGFFARKGWITMPRRKRRRRRL